MPESREELVAEADLVEANRTLRYAMSRLQEINTDEYVAELIKKGTKALAHFEEALHNFAGRLHDEEEADAQGTPQVPEGNEG